MIKFDNLLRDLDLSSCHPPKKIDNVVISKTLATRAKPWGLSFNVKGVEPPSPPPPPPLALPMPVVKVTLHKLNKYLNEPKKIL